MKRPWLLVALGIGAFVLFALVTLPASVVLSRLGTSGIQAGGVSGTIWNGRAQVLQAVGVHVGSVQWRLHVLPLLRARVAVDLDVRRIDGFAKAALAFTPPQHVALEDVTASLPIQALPPVAGGSWGGTLNVKVASLVVDNGWPTAIEGTIEARDVMGPARKGARAALNLGSYKVTFPADAKTVERADGVLIGALVDTGGPLQVNGTLQLKADRTYVIDGLIFARPDAPGDIAKSLEYLGPPDAQGRRQFSLAGSM